MRYADPALCPDCRSPLPPDISTCPTCRLLVRHPLAVELFGALRRADVLLASLRAAGDAAQRAPQPATAAQAPAPPPLPSYAPPAPPRQAVPTPGALRTSSVPKILLGLGALCLLVAAITFLAVSWSALGVGGRTAVLVGLTVSAGAAALLLHRAGLRIAGESLVVVALGLLALDVTGAGAAGWFGDSPDGVVAATAGLLVAGAAIGLGLLRMGDRPRLVAPQVIAGIGLFVAHLGAGSASDHWLLTGHLMTGVAIAVVLLARSQRTDALAWSATTAAGLAWLVTGGIALGEALDHPELHQLWVRGSGWSLLVTAAVLLAPGLVTRQRPLLLAGGSGAALVVTGTLTVPCIDAGSPTVELVVLGVTAAWTLALALLPRAIRVVALAPAAAGGLGLIGVGLAATATALERWSRLGDVFTEPFAVRLTGPAPEVEPLVLVPALLVVVTFLALIDPDRARRALPTWGRVAGAGSGIAAAATIASYDVPLVLPVAVLVAVALLTMLWATLGDDAEAAVWAWVAMTVGATVAMGALPSDGVTLAVLLPLAVAATTLAVLGRHALARIAGGVGAPILLGLTAAAGAMVVSDDAAWVAVPVLLAVGVIALALPRLDVEATAVAVALVAFPVSLAVVEDAGAYAALWLTVAGFLVSGTALLHESRRRCALAGGALLLLASWVRLADLEVSQPEPYTLPLAAALLGFGLWRMQRSPAVGSVQALLPGLVLATLPSLLWVLGDPLSLRALLLGGACLALTVAGASLRWSAPLLVGAAVGAAVVVRELGPYAGEFPKWVWIGLAGALLTVVGITWERRLLDVRRAVGLLGRLR